MKRSLLRGNGGAKKSFFSGKETMNFENKRQFLLVCNLVIVSILQHSFSSPLLHLQGMEGNKRRKPTLVDMWDERFVFWKTRKTRKNNLFENNDNNGKQQYFFEDKKDKKNNLFENNDNNGKQQYFF